MENLEAVVAGGALVGPVTEQDLYLDVGGNTTSLVENYLHDHQITIVKSETGGYFSCKVSLNLKDLSTNIEPLGLKRDAPETFIMKLLPEQIDLLISGVRPIPQIALKISRIIHTEQYDMKTIAHEIRLDQVLSAKVLRLCNSALLAGKERIDTIETALSRIGERLLLQYVISSSMELFYQGAEHGYSLCKGGIFQHAILTAQVAEAISRFTGIAVPDQAYVAGLLHDIGKVILDQYIAKAYPFFYRRVFEEEVNILEAENEILGTNHTIAGKRMAVLWDLPESIQEVIEFHHFPEKSTEYSELTHLVYLADILVSRFRVGSELERVDTQSLPGTLDKLSLDKDSFLRIVEQIQWGQLITEI